MARWQDFSELWICLNCRSVGPLTEHGRCATCDSDSVAVADLGRPFARNDAQEREDELRIPAWATVAGGLSHPPPPRIFSAGMRQRRAPGHRRTIRYR